MKSGPELSLAAALRDASALRPEARSLAIRSLAPALLDEIGMRPPAFWELVEHPQREEVVAALELACDDPAPHDAALARIGLAELTAPGAHDRAREAIAADSEEPSDEAAMFLRECGVICLSLIGAAARDVLATPGRCDEAVVARAERLRGTVLAELRELLSDPRPDVRFQAAPALVEVGGESVEAALIAAFEAEDQSEVRANLIVALSMLDPPGAAACDLLAAVLRSEEAKGEVGWEAAMALTAARRPEGAPRLLEALRRQATRDRALEALAVLGRNAPAKAAEAVGRLTSSFLIPVFTRVRAAYALARIEPERGEALLDRLAHHPRAAVREAVAEARVNLARLTAQEAGPLGDAYRRE